MLKKAKGLLVTSLYIITLLLFIITYSSRGVLLAWILGANLINSDRRHSKELRSYYFPNSFGLDYLLVLGLKKNILLKSTRVNTDDEEVHFCSIQSFFRYFPYSLISYFLLILYIVNYLFLGLFFQKNIVRSLLYFIKWMHGELFILFFKREYTSSDTQVVVI